MISNEAQSQIYKLTQSVADFNEKINSYQIRESELVNENSMYESQIKMLQDKVSNYEKIINKLEKTNDNASVSSNLINKSTFSLQEKDGFNEKLKLKLKEKDSYISNLENEINMLKKELYNKDEDFDKIYSDLQKSSFRNENNVQQLEYKISKKEEEINSVSKKNADLCHVNNRLQETLADFKSKLVATEKENYSKSGEGLKLKRHYEKIINDLQSKLEDVILKEDRYNSKQNMSVQFENKPKTNREYPTKNQFDYSYHPKELPDDEKIRKAINDQINYIKNKLETKK